ncbi:MAG: hypothetical protein IJS41_03985 [Clostridia bacterium]|nr:hypothetical protein [Clostridia bacterium]
MIEKKEEGVDKGRFHGISGGGQGSRGRVSVREMFQKVAILSEQYGSKEVILVDVDTGECVTGKSFVDILTDDRITWNILWEVEVISIRNDYGHLSVVYDSGVEQGNGDPDKG